MVEKLWRFFLYMLNAHVGSRVALHGANAQTIIRDTEALFIAATDDCLNECNI